MKQLTTTKPTVATHVLLLALALFGAVALLVGCRFWALQPKVGAVAALAAVPTVSAIPAETRGELRLRILWPDRNLKGFRAAAIPTSTNALVLRISKGEDEVARKLISRPADGSPNDVSLKLDAASNLSVEVKAYREADPDLATATPIARGTAIINIRASRATSQTLKLDALFAPTITALSANAGAAGDTITLTGENLGLVASATPTVVFNSVNASVSAQVTPIDSTKLSVVVPQGAAVGRVVVTSDGIPSTSNAICWIASALQINAPKASWDSSQGQERKVVFGHDLQFSPKPTWALRTSDAEGDFGMPPAEVSWRSSDEAVGKIDQTGRFTANGLFASCAVTAGLGSITSPDIKVTAVGVKVSISPTYGELGPAGAESIKFVAMNTLSDGSTNSLVTFSASTDSVSIDSGKGIAVGGTGPTSATITARSQLQAFAEATASVKVRTWFVSTVAGTGWGYRDGDAASAEFLNPTDVALAPDGTIFVADSGNFRVRKISLAGMVSTFAGNGTASVLDGAGTKASFSRVSGLAITPVGNLYVLDLGCVRKVDVQANTSTVAGQCGQTGYVDDKGPKARFGSSGSERLVSDGTGNVLILDRNNHAVRKMAPDGTVTSVWQGLWYPSALGLGPDGTIFVSNSDGKEFLEKQPGGGATRIAGDGTQGFGDGPALSSKFLVPAGVAVDSQGDVLVADMYNSRIRKIAGSIVSTIAGGGGPKDRGGGYSDGPALSAAFWAPQGIAFDASGNLIIADSDNSSIRKLTPEGQVVTVAGKPVGYRDGPGSLAHFKSIGGMAADGLGNLFVIDQYSTKIRRISAGGMVSTVNPTEPGFKDGPLSQAQFGSVNAVTADPVGNLYVVDSSYIRRISADGQVKTIAGDGVDGTIDGTGSEARVRAGDLAFGPDGNLYLGQASAVRKITPQGAVTTLANTGCISCSNIAVDQQGTVYLHSCNEGRKVSPSGEVSSFSLGACNSLLGIDAGGYAYHLPDGGKQVLRTRLADGVVTSLWNASEGDSDGTIATARFSEAFTAGAIDFDGNLFLAHQRRIRKLAKVP